MKQLFLLMFAIISSVCANAQVGITVEDATIVRGTTDKLVIKLDNTVDVNGLQFKLSVPEGVKIEIAKPYKPQVCDRTEDFSITTELQEDGSIGFMIVSLAKSIIEPGEGEIMTIYLTSDNNIAYGTYYSEMRDIIVSHSDHQKLTLNPITWKCTITEKVSIKNNHFNEVHEQTYRLDGIRIDDFQNGINVIKGTKGIRKVLK